MSLFRLPPLRGIASSMGHLRDRFTGRRSGRGVTERVQRRLVIDTLEARQLLTVSPVGPIDHLVNESFVGDVGDDYEVASLNTLASQSIAVDSDGDFVVTWTRYDYVIDPATGQRVMDPITGEDMMDSNIYARYFTDEVQRVMLPSELGADNVAGAYGRFSLSVGGPEVQKLTISSLPQPYTDEMFLAPVTGTFSVGFDVNGNGSIGAGERFTMVYDEATLEANEAMMQAGLRGLGGALTDVVVDCVAAGEFYINFGEQSGSLAQPEIVIDPSFTNWTSGFYPAALMSTVREPVTIANIPVHSSDPFATAQVIEQMFLYTMANTSQSPTEFLWTPKGPFSSPDVVRYADFRVSVTPVIDPATLQYSTTTFDFTFIDESGKTNVPEMVVTMAKDDRGISRLTSSQLDVATIKEPSPEFRVNDPEPDDPFTPWPDKTNQNEPAVVMDKDGDFVITWTSEVGGVVSDTSVKDIHARRFSAVGWVEDPTFEMADGTKVQSVVPLGDAFRVNTATNGVQDESAVGMDADGNFTVAWVSTAQDIGFFNHISAQKFNRDGQRIGGEFVVLNLQDETDTSIHYNPYVAVSDEGYVLITWCETDDPNHLPSSDAGGSGINARLYSEDMTKTVAWHVATGWEPAADFDSANNFSIVYELRADTDHIRVPNLIQSLGVFGQMYSVVETETGIDSPLFHRLRSEFRVNSSDINNPRSATNWSGDQVEPQVMLDADGDMTVVYEGFGPDVSDATSITGDYFANLINSTTNADLLPYFDPQMDGLVFVPAEGGGDPSGDIDTEIEVYLVKAYNAGATPEQIGRLGAVLNLVADLVRGDSNGIYFSSYDADADSSETQMLAQDSIVNSQRDGENARYLIYLDTRATTGNFQVALTYGGVLEDPAAGTGWTYSNGGNEAEINITPVYNNNVFNAVQTAEQIEDDIQDRLDGVYNARAGQSDSYWTEPNLGVGTVDVRLINNTQEWSARAGTPWAWPDSQPYYAVYEVSFSGNAHDTWINMGLGTWWQSGDMNIDANTRADAPIIMAVNYGSAGEQQTAVSAGMQPDGDYVAAWTQWEEITNGGVTAQNVYFREFNETAIDDAGPRVTDFLTRDGYRLTNGGQVIDTMNYVVVTFDEELTLQGTHGVTNPANWSLLKDGVQLSGGVSKVLFGMNMSTTLGLNTVGSNKWEAVVFFDGNGVTAGTPALGGGNYEIVASNSIWDANDNSLGRTGYNPTGAAVSRSFYLVPPVGTETLVNTGETTGDQVSVETTLPPEAVPNSPRSIAGDADGEYVVVWTSEDPGNPGVFAKVYRTEWTGTGTARVSNTVTVKEFRITADPTASYASVARDADGDFVVTWSQWNDATEWDIYAARFDAVGNAVGINDVQNLSLYGNMPGTFRLQVKGMSTGDITWNNNIQETAIAIQSQLNSLGIHAIVTPRGDTDIKIQFTGADGYQNQDLIKVTSFNGGSVAPDTEAKVTAITEGQTPIFRVNTFVADTETDPAKRYSDHAQRYSTVAMDDDGDFIITWQSEGQDGNGYGIYAQRYSRTGEVLDGVDEIQVVRIGGDITSATVGDITSATFTLEFDGQITAPITYTGNLAATAADIQAKLELLGVQVTVKLLNDTDIAVQFQGEHGRRDVVPLVLNHATIVGTGEITIIMAIEGEASEFQVNDTVGGNQVFPSVGMDATGDYIISWTSFGQDGDTANESNIYAKRYGAGEDFISPTDRLARLAERWNWTAPEGVEVKPFITYWPGSGSHLVYPGQGYDGVVELFMHRTDGDGLGSGTLLLDGYHILTAAHNVCDDFGNLVATNVEVVFWINAEPFVVTVNSAAIYVHPDYNGQPWSGGADLAVLVLEDMAPAAAERFDIYRGEDEVGQDFHKFGYGSWGDGVGGATEAPDDWMRHGWNTWEATGEMMAQFRGEYYSSDGLMYDFDGGGYDTFGTLFGMPDAGTGGANEISGAPGDSGGPSFIGNLIAGVTSYGTSFVESDIKPGTNSSFGDVGVDQRVSTYAEWIDAVSLVTSEFLVNTTIVGDQKWSSVAMDADGDYVITWTSYNQDSGTSVGYLGDNDVMAQRYTAGNIPVNGEFQVNTYTADNQQHSQVSLDADGDFIITWESFQDRPAIGSGPDTGTSYGVYAQRYASNDKLNNSFYPFVGPDGRVGNEIHVNLTTAGEQRMPGVMVSDAGDAVIAWTGQGVGDPQGVFTQRFEVLKDDAGPTASDVLEVLTDVNGNPTGQTDVVLAEEVIEHQVGQLVVRFGENLNTSYSTSGANSILNPNNWQLTRYGSVMTKAIKTIEFGLNKAYELGLDIAPSGKYEAVVTLDGDSSVAGVQTLGDGGYELTVLSNVQDRFGNNLDGDLDGTPGGNFTYAFAVQSAPIYQGDVPVIGPPGTEDGRTYPETPNAIAADADGDHVIVWTATTTWWGLMVPEGSNTEFNDGETFTIKDAGGRSVTFEFDANGVVDSGHVPLALADFVLQTPVDGGVSILDGETFTLTDVNDQVVTFEFDKDASTTSGNVAIAIAGSDTQSVIAQKMATAINEAVSNHLLVAVAATAVGTEVMIEGPFNLTQSADAAVQESSSLVSSMEIVERIADAIGRAVDSSSLIGVTPTVSGPLIRLDGVVDVAQSVTASLVTVPPRDRVYGQRYDANGTAKGSPFELTPAALSAFLSDDQRHASVAMDEDGDFVVTWTNYRDTNGDGVNEELDIYARRYRADGAAMSNPFRVNTYTANAQIWSDVAMDVDGDFVITWSSFGQEDNQQLGYGYGVYARRFDSFGASLGAEFAVNVTKTGNQQFPTVAMDADGDFIIAWTSDQAVGDDNIIARAFKSDGSPMPIDNVLQYAGEPGQPMGPHGGEILVNTTTDGDQRYADVGMDMTGQHFIIAWSSDIKDTSGYGVYARRLMLNGDGYVVPDSTDPFEFRVNTSITWNQMYPSVSMNWDGSFIVTWSGYGTRPGDSDTSGYGVFYQRYDENGYVVGDEYRANSETLNNQWFSSVATDANGNFYLVWTGVGDGSSTGVYRFVGKNRFVESDTTGPIITDVLSSADRSRLIQDATIESSAGVTTMIFVFNESVSTTGGTTGTTSILNPNNWSLVRNGSEIQLGVKSITFGYNTVSRKYEAVLTFDSNGLNAGSPGLTAGDYVLTLREIVTDGTNRLDGNYDSAAGGNYTYNFSVASGAVVGPEYRVNQTTSYEQGFSTTLGLGMGLESSNRSVAIDHDGDFVVVWTSYGQDDPTDPAGGGVYMRVFDRNNNALTPETRVNTFTAGHQRNAEVAMDADGDFVIVWESEGNDVDGSVGIFGQRFDAMGRKVGDEFRVNSEYMGEQVKPAVAMNNRGEFVVTYVSSYGQDFSYFQDLLGQRFNERGEAVGGEFQINQASIPLLQTVAYSQATVNSAVAMDENGGFVVTWDTFVAQADGIIYNSLIVARMFNSDGTPRTNEGRVDVSTISGTGKDTFTDPEHFELQNAVDTIGPSDIRRTARNPQIAMDGQGNFTIVWESWRDNDVLETPPQGDEGSSSSTDWPDSYGIYFHQFNADGSRRTNIGDEPGFDYNANMVHSLLGAYDPLFAGAQVNPSIGIDVDGDFVVSWNGLGAEPDPLYSANYTITGNYDTEGVFLRYFSSSVGPNIADYISQQQRANYTDGGSQQFSTIAMEPDGDMVVVWSGAGVGDQYGIFYRRYNESADTAGPLATGLQSLDGTPIEAGGQVIANLEYAIVTFDEELLNTSGTNGVLNLANWSLLKKTADGSNVQMAGGIKQVQFGLNKSFELGLSAVKSNKWEAVLSMDGNGVGSGTPVLGGGEYTIVVSNAIRDVAGNPLGRTGYAPQGGSASTTFYVVPPTGSETLVNGQTTGNQVVLDTSGDPDLVPNSPRAIAGDADGEYVVVWTSEDPTSAGVWAKVYRTEWTGTASARVANTSVVTEFRVSADPTASYASVARDGDGDFVVTWSQYDATTGWDVWYQRFDALGRAQGDAEMANTEAASEQRYSTVAMDNDGDFIIAWQSEGQDGSGYGIYAQRYSRTGEKVGGTNEIQVVRLVGTVTAASFKLNFDGLVTGLITYDGDLNATAVRIETEMAALGVEVNVEVLNETDLGIEFVNHDGRRDVAPLVLTDVSATGGELEWLTAVEGETSEFRVNDTFLGDQRFPSAAMDADGGIVVSWTSYGQDGDAPSDSNIYAKLLSSNDVLPGVSAMSRIKESLTPADTGGIVLVPMIVSKDDPDNHIVNPGTGYDGVVLVENAEGMGTGSLLTTGRHILTAAHVVADEFGNALPFDTVSVTFHMADGDVTISASEVIVHPEYNGDVAYGHDLAIIVLSEEAPAEAERYDIYRGTEELGPVFDKYGYGRIGTGSLGADTDPDGNKRTGENRYEMLGGVFGGSDDALIYDFDSGYALNDAFGLYFNMQDTGLGEREISAAQGDSGGPNFIDGKIAAVTSYGFSIPGPQDSNLGINSSYGDFGGDQRVSTYAGWIDGITRGTGEILVNAFIDGDQKWSSVAMDLDGDFVITWTGYGQDREGTGSGTSHETETGVFAQRFLADGTKVTSNEFQVNTYEAGNQQHSQVAIDADGDFIITWESFQESPSSPTSYGVYAQRFAADPSIAVGQDGRVGSEIHVNTTTAGDQRLPSVMVSHAGDAVIAWTGPGTGGSLDVFTQRYEVLADQAGPVVTDVLSVTTDTDGNVTGLVTVADTGNAPSPVTQLVIRFGENLNTTYSTSGPNSVLNPNNWQLLRAGTVVSKGVKSVEFGLSKAGTLGLETDASGKYEAVITLDGDPNVTGVQSLTSGAYTLVIGDTVYDLFGNALDGNLDGDAGGNYQITFTVRAGGSDPDDPNPPDDPTSNDAVVGPGHTDAETPGAVAVDSDGDYIVVWTDTVTVGSQQYDRVYGRRYSAGGVAKGNAFEITPAELTTYQNRDQQYASVAIDADGDFIVTWSQNDGTDAVPDWNVYARRYSGNGASVAAPFRLNTYTANTQKWSDVAVDADGDFVVTWTSRGQEAGSQSGYGIYARRYDRFGYAYGPEFLVNTTTAGNQQFPSVAMGAEGEFVIAWQSNRGSLGDDIFARAYNADGSPAVSPLAGEFLVNDTVAGNQRYPDVAMNLDGTSYAITWSSSQGTDDPNGYGVYAKTFDFITNAGQTLNYAYTGPVIDFAEGQSVTINIEVGQNFLIEDLNVHLSIRHEDPSDLFVYLLSPDGTQVILFQEVPPAGDALGSTQGGGNGQDFIGTILDDEPAPGAEDTVPIEDGLPPFTGTYAPQEALSAFDDRNALGTWKLVIEDRDPDDDPDIGPIYGPDGGRFLSARLEFTRSAASSVETLVNTTTSGNQVYSSVAMDAQGNFVVAWCGVGTAPGQEDTSEYGVFTKRFTAALEIIDVETRINVTTAGMQWLPSVGSDADGNYVVAWTGDATGGTTNVYHYASVLGEAQEDVEGAIVADVFAIDSTSVYIPLLNGSVTVSGTTHLIVSFSEQLSIAETVVGSSRTPAIESVLNPENWIIERAGMEIHGGISSISFQLNPATGRYEAVVTLDGNGLSAGTPGLGAGEYVLSLRDLVEDVAGNRLDGDYDGLPGTDPGATGYSGYRLAFSVSDTDHVFGEEQRVNQSVDDIQILSEPKGTGYARETTTMSVAVDNDGDYVVVWTTYADDLTNDADVYARLYDRNNNPLTDEFRVNNITAGWQGNAAVAMDADGDFIVAWEGEAGDGTLDVYAQRFTATGSRVANDRDSRLLEDPYRNVAGSDHIEALVNSTTTGEQFNPAVDMDSFGNYMIVWGSAGQDFSYFNSVMAQRFNYRGETLGDEFQVNTQAMPGASGTQQNQGFLVNPSVAMSDAGLVAVTWDRSTQQTSGVTLNTDVVARLFDADNAPLLDVDGVEIPEFVVNTDEVISPDATHDAPDGGQGGSDISRTARNPQVAMDTAGNFIIVFEAYLDNDTADTDEPDSYGIYYRRYDALGTPMTDEIQQANTVVTADEDAAFEGTASEALSGNQVNPTIAVDADGDFAIFWNGRGAQPDPLDPENADLMGDMDDAGVFGRWFHAGTASVVSAPTTAQQRANETQAGVQQFASAAMEPDGDLVVVWAGNGVGDRHGIFVRHYNQTSDTAGPIATELRSATGDHDLIGAGDNLYGANPQTLWVVFDEALNATAGGLHSVTNVNNWALVNGRGEELAGRISSVVFSFNTAINKWVAAVNFSDPGGLANGTYTLVARSAIWDVAGNPLARTGYQPYGTGRRYDAAGNEIPLDPATSPTGGFGFQFTVNNTFPGTPSAGTLDQLVSETPEIVYGDGDLGQIGYQDTSDVARNASGDYVVVWVEYTEVISTAGMTIPADAVLQTIPAEPVLEANIRAQRFDSSGRERGDAILVNTFTTGNQLEPAVAIDGNGNFVVVWSGAGTELGDDAGVFAQRFDADGGRLGGQFRVNFYNANTQDEPAVAMNANTGDFVITWSSFKQDGSSDGVYMKRFRANGLAYADETLVNTTTTGAQGDSAVAVNTSGAYVVTWTCEQEGSGRGIQAQRYSATGAKVGGEIHVNSYTNGDQLDPAVGIDKLGNFVVTWTSPQDGSGTGVYAQRFNAAGVKQGVEFRVNQTTLHDQFDADVSMSTDGLFVVVWTCFNNDTTPPNQFIRDWSVCARTYNADGTDYNHALAGVVREFRVNGETAGNQYAPAVSMDPNGHYVVTWSGASTTIDTFIPNPDTTGGGDEFIAAPRSLTAIYTRFIDPPVAESAGDATPVDVVINGTTGNDVFEFLGGPTTGSWVVKLNGTLQTLPEYVATLRFDGKAGQDTVIVSGANANDTVELWSDHGSFTSVDYNVVVSNVETVTATGGGGTDLALLHDSAGDDTFTGQADGSQLTGTGFSITVQAFETVRALADGGGTDTAQLYDSAGDDTLTATPGLVKMSGSGYLLQAEGYEYNKAYANGTGTDVADLYDSTAADTLNATPTYAKLYNDAGYWVMATGFNAVRAYSTAGGQDVANMFGSAADDTFTGAPTYARFQGTGFYNRADYFEVVNANGQGGSDTASLYDSTGNDTFVAGPRYGQMFGPGFQVRADFFRWVYGYANNGGDDLASLYDSSGNDNLLVTQNYAQLYGDAYFNRAFGFDRVEARATGGGYDKADLHDSALNDYLEGEGDWIRLSNADLGFAYWAASFDQVTARSTNQGDTKKITDIDYVLATEGTWTDQ